MQARFLHRLGISGVNALMNFNLAPLSTRRDIAMLGVVHRAVLQEGPEQLRQFFEIDETLKSSPTRAATRRHKRQLVEHRRGRFSETVRRSALGLVFEFEFSIKSYMKIFPAGCD